LEAVVKFKCGQRNSPSVKESVNSGTSVKQQVNEVEDFLELVVKGHIIAAALHFFSMSVVSDSPKTSVFPSNVNDMGIDRRKKLLHAKMEQIIDRYVVPHKLGKTTENMSTNSATVDPVSDSPNAPVNPHLKSIQQDHDYTQSTVSRKGRALPQFVSAAASRSEEDGLG